MVLLPVGKLLTEENFYKDVPKIHRQEYIADVSNVYKNKRRPTFQAAIKTCLVIGQCFGLCPVLGICEIDTHKLRFSFYSGRCLYSIISIIGQVLLLLLCLIKLLTDATDSAFVLNTSVVFFGTNCLTTMIFVRVAMRWPKLCHQIAMVEASDATTDSKLVRRCSVSCIVVLFLAANNWCGLKSTVEHILSDVSGLALAIDCKPEKNLYEAFILQSFPFVWTYLDYNPVFGMYIQFLNIQCTFNWNFADAFVICISYYLISRLEQINKRLKAVRGKYVPSSFWRTMREDYSRTTNMVKKVDDVICSIVFISFANNLFFICVQLLHTLAEGIKRTPACHRSPDDRPFNGYEQAAYFVYSFSFLVLRSLAMSLIAARVHTASREPAYILYNVPSQGYCIEVQRLLHQIQGDTIAITGLRFFNVKRGLVLTIAGTIVTYELVLMQFTGVTPTISPPTIDLPSLFPTGPSYFVINNNSTSVKHVFKIGFPDMYN